LILVHVLIIAGLLMVKPVTVPAAADPAGPRLAVIEIVGNTRTRDFVIERELLCRIGDPARGLELETMESRLHNIGLFSAVEVTVDTVSVPGAAKLVVMVKERPAILPVPIADNSTKNGLTLGGVIHHLNFRGRNERLSLLASGGGVGGVTALFSNPWVAWNHFSITVSGGYWHERNRFDDFTEKTWTVGASFGLYLSKNERWRTRLNTSYLSLASDEVGKTIDPNNHDRLHSVGLELTYDSRVLYRNPRSAWRIVTGLSWIGGALGGTVDYTHYLVDARRYQPVPIGRTLALQARLVRRAGTVPDYRRVRLGGSSSIRGYDGGAFEGHHAALASIEYRFDLTATHSYDLGPVKNLDFGLAAGIFVDAGVAWDDDDALRWDRVATGSGFGLRLFVPWVEVVRIDLAFTDSRHVEVEFGEGMKF
jgi:outer membrane protein insertion porin family